MADRWLDAESLQLGHRAWHQSLSAGLVDHVWAGLHDNRAQATLSSHDRR
jgi:hypothetical protein